MHFRIRGKSTLTKTACTALFNLLKPSNVEMYSLGSNRYEALAEAQFPVCSKPFLVKQEHFRGLLLWQWKCRRIRPLPRWLKSFPYGLKLTSRSVGIVVGTTSQMQLQLTVYSCRRLQFCKFDLATSCFSFYIPPIYQTLDGSERIFIFKKMERFLRRKSCGSCTGNFVQQKFVSSNLNQMKNQSSVSY